MYERNLPYGVLINDEWKKSEPPVYSTQIPHDTCIKRHDDVMSLYSVLQVNLEPCSFVPWPPWTLCGSTQRQLRSALWGCICLYRNPTDYELSGSNLSTLLSSVMDDETNHIHRDREVGGTSSPHTKATVSFPGSLFLVVLYRSDIWGFSSRMTMWLVIVR